MDCEAAREHLDALALGALDTEERRAAEAHVASCEACAALAQEARETAHALAFATPLRQPSAALKSRILAAAAVLRDVREGRRSRWWAAAAAAAVVGGVALAAWAGYLQMEVDDLNERNAALRRDATSQAAALAAVRESLGDRIDTQSQVLAIISHPDAVRTEMWGTEAAPGARGWYVWSSAEQLGALDADGMPPPPPGSAYQLWFIYEKGWVNAGSLELEADGSARTIVRRTWSGDWGQLQGYAVTAEPAAGAMERSGEPVLASAGDW